MVKFVHNRFAAAVMIPDYLSFLDINHIFLYKGIILEYFPF